MGDIGAGRLRNRALDLGMPVLTRVALTIFRSAVICIRVKAPDKFRPGLWFVAHPHRSYRVRPQIPGEWPPGSLPAPRRGWREYTVIRQVLPGFRLRLAFSAEGEPGQGERAAERLYEIMLRGGP